MDVAPGAEEIPLEAFPSSMADRPEPVDDGSRRPSSGSSDARLLHVVTAEDPDQWLLSPRPRAFLVRQVIGTRLVPTTFAPWQLAVKRTLDLCLATVLLVMSLPVVVIAAIAIKVEDGGPIFYRQTRVGRDSQPFTILKLRTMIPGAEHDLHRLAAANVRTGPLFKVPADPRVTGVGRILRASSIDELPQLLNVLHGTMSLVGPRPALPDEVAQFDVRLMGRLDVKPGVTGLWQVEARDDPAFERYQTLDLYYVRHWSTRLDVAILLSTIRPVLHRLYRAARRRAATLTLPVAGEGTASQVLD